MVRKDKVIINRLQTQAITGKDYWNRPTLQPLEVSIELSTNFQASSVSDDLRHSLNYAVISKNILEFFEKNRTKNFKSFENIANAVSEVVLNEKRGGGKISKVSVSGKKTEIRTDKIEVIVNRFKEAGVTVHDNSINDKVIVTGLKLQTLIGVFTFERLQKQYVTFDLDVEYNKPFNFYSMIDDVSKYTENSNFKTVEALIESVAQIICQNYDIIKVIAKVEKPNAITFSTGVGVEVERTPEFFTGVPKLDIQNTLEDFKTSFNLPTNELRTPLKEENTAYIAFGSNVGNQLANIIGSIDKINASGHSKVVATSSLYESEPMYYLDQPKFINGVFQISTKLSPHELLSFLKEIEYVHLGREKLIENGPRSIDLDILLYNDLVLNTNNLTIPHIRMIERTFVLQPLCELISPEAIHPVTAEPYHNHLKHLYASQADASKQKSNLLQTHVPLYNKYYQFNKSRNLTLDLLFNSHKTQLMGILNTTPDSFSDGGKNASVEIAIKNALHMVYAGVDIIDIGGVSTRPGSVAPDPEEEWNRVIPIIEAIRNHENERLRNILISVDTYRASIALDSVKAGADIINDISGGLFDDEMFKVVADTGVAYILNHTRGTPDTMSKLNTYLPNEDVELIEYVNTDEIFKPEDEILLKAISRELCIQYEKAIKAGVKRWQIITDPGIGFAKNLKQNLAIIRGTPLIKKYSNLNETKGNYNSLDGLPILLGPSRKKFIGTLTNEKDPAERVLTTSAVIMSCVGYKADIVRVHDVEEVKKVLLIGDALYKDLI
ncbi:hypothetical protein WICMUC_000529 [Wickerhamomyces mucosus]|uniref:Folic acid synthesis protein fol1 n=1 Tax=Wickerhamomyces mucosus TaxID=1378264 RepID=A0A9P8PX94_9ASCO|nr:hypothetical protein WICMUC_000529 [Wickerhamomyces mucosus]